MPTLEITSNPGQIFTISFEGYFQDKEQKNNWQQFVKYTVQYAFGNRSVAAITISPMSWSVGYMLPNSGLIRVNQEEYLINHVFDFSADLLTKIIESEDFNRGLLWLIGLTKAEEKKLMTLIQEINVSSERLSMDGEILLVLDDGRRLDWLHPKQNIKELQNILKNSAKRLGWEINLSEIVQG